MFNWLFASLLLSSPVGATDPTDQPICGNDDTFFYQFLECSGKNTALWVLEYKDPDDPEPKRELRQIQVISRWCVITKDVNTGAKSKSCYAPGTIGGCLVEHTRALCGKGSK